MNNIPRLSKAMLLFRLWLIFITIVLMNSCMKRQMQRRVNPKNIVVYDSIPMAGGYYGYWYAYDFGGFYGGIGDFIAISKERTNINYDNQIIVSEYIKGIEKVNDSVLQVILEVETYDQSVEIYQGIKVSIKVD